MRDVYWTSQRFELEDNISLTEVSYTCGNHTDSWSRSNCEARSLYFQLNYGMLYINNSNMRMALLERAVDLKTEAYSAVVVVAVHTGEIGSQTPN